MSVTRATNDQLIKRIARDEALFFVLEGRNIWKIPHIGDHSKQTFKSKIKLLYFTGITLTEHHIVNDT